MRIVFYMPFKPLNHPHPSGDLVIGTELFEFLRRRGHDIHPVSRLRSRWLYWKPWQWIRIPLEIERARRLARRLRPQVWLTYHSYYKAPDVLGAQCAPTWGIPYAIFQGVYATKYRRRLKTAPGFYLNRHALLRADTVLTNKRRDHTNLRRLLPESRLHYIAPGIRLEGLRSDRQAVEPLRQTWGAGDLPVILTAAMFRPDVKTEGLARVIKSCGRIARRGLRFKLIICGDGMMKAPLQRLARDQLGDWVHFAGQVPRDRMRHYYHNADLFVFPGIQESLGMVFLEAQSAGLPVVACDGWGAAEVVRRDRTGLLSRPGDWERFEHNIARLLTETSLRSDMGRAAARHVARHHDLDRNYQRVETLLQRLADRPTPDHFAAARTP